VLGQQRRGEEEGDQDCAEPPAAGGDEGGAEQGGRGRPAGIEEVASPGGGADRGRGEQRDGDLAGGNGEGIQVDGSGEGRIGGVGMAGPIPGAVRLSCEAAPRRETL
jgi:hypothetical protein